jgi:hypothetical protein
MGMGESREKLKPKLVHLAAAQLEDEVSPETLRPILGPLFAELLQACPLQIFQSHDNMKLDVGGE